MFDYCAQLIPLNPKFWYNSFFDASYDLNNGGPNFTICPKCGVPIRGFHGSTANGWWPKVCTHCCSELPTEPYFDDPPVNDKADDKAEDKVDDKNDDDDDYDTLLDLIKRL